MTIHEYIAAVCQATPGEAVFAIALIFGGAFMIAMAVG